MEHIPAVVIGNILSLLVAARDVVRASTTCKRWREAWLNHVHSLSFNFSQWGHLSRHIFGQREFEIFITQTILQTKGLQCLSICMDDLSPREFPAVAVIAWLMHTQGTLKKLCFSGRVAPRINIFKSCGRQKLQELSLSYISVTGVHLNYPAFRSLSLTGVHISALDLSGLITNCPKLETLCLIGLFITDYRHTSIKLTSASLKYIFIESPASGFNKFTLEADSIENLHLKRCTLDPFELVGKGSLRVLKIEDCKVANFDIGENTGNLEVLDVNKFTITLARFYHMISRSSKLSTLRLQDVMFQDEYGFVDFETLLACFPQLSQLSLCDDHAPNCASHLFCFPPLSKNDNGSSYLQNVTVLELGCTALTEQFSSWVAGFLERCPRLKKLVINGVVRSVESQVIADFTTSIVGHMRKYNHVDVKFKYE